MKSVLFISSDGFPSKANPTYGIFTYEQAKAIDNHHVELVDLQTNSSNKIYTDKFNKIVIHILLYAKFNLIKILKNLLYLNKLRKINKPSLVICSFLNLRNIVYSQFINTKIITIVHGSDAIVSSSFKKIIFRKFLDKNYKIFTVSKYTKKTLINTFKSKSITNKIIVVYNGISRNKLNLKNLNILKKVPNNKIIILCIANLVPRKNIPYLIKVFKLLNLRNVNKYHLVIVGDGTERYKIQNILKQENLKKNITILKSLTDSEVSSLFKKSKFFCLFSKLHNNQFEGFGIVFIEAMYKKSIVFASKHGGIKELVHDNFNGFSYNLDNENTYFKIIKKIETMTKNTQAQKRIISNAYNFSLKFTWKKNINLILNASL